MDKINDPANYRRLCEPITQADANKRVGEFLEELYTLRNKYGIRDVFIVTELTIKNEDGQEGELMAIAHFGNHARREPMAAYAFGAEQARRELTIAAVRRGAAKQTK